MESKQGNDVFDVLPGSRRDWLAAGFCADSPFPARVTPYYASLIRGSDPRDPIALQAVPRAEETDPAGLPDPLGENARSPVPGLVHVYEDRVLVMPTSACAVHCRHCNRRWRRDVAGPAPWHEMLPGWLDYLRRRQVAELLVTGGDPLMLPPEAVGELLARLRETLPASVLRIGSRLPVVDPQRITPALCATLSRWHPVYVNVQFNCPAECTPDAGSALTLLADAGIALGNQMVLLKGVNDSTEEILRVNRWLVNHRCRPYYLFLTERVRGTRHLWVSAARGLEIASQLQRGASGLLQPHVVVDTPDGGGKVPLTPDRVRLHETRAIVTDLKGREVVVED
ncbi:MAG: KamA family radical SAM protein [Deltaproteobacteria bacterium]|nr:KamA family radical SAM protein [Deltaproteobacteria bacterium]